MCNDLTVDLTSYGYGWASSNSSVVSMASGGGLANGVGAGENVVVSAFIWTPILYRYKCPLDRIQPISDPVDIQVPKFDIEYSSYIPVDHVYAPSVCSYGGPSYPLIYRGDAYRGTYRTREFMILVPDIGQAYGFTPSTSETRNYGYGSPANGVTLSSADEDGVGRDCYLYNDSAQASAAGFQLNTTFPASHQGQLQFYGESANPLEYQWFSIQWNETTTINTTYANNMTASVSYNVTCYPAHQVKVNGNPVFTFTPPENSASYITQCLGGAAPHVSGSVGPITVQPYY